MISKYRQQFNSNFTHQKYSLFLQNLTRELLPISFRVAETPIFIPTGLQEKLIAAGEEIIHLIRRPDFKELTSKSIPDQWKVPGEEKHPHFLTFDFGICKDQNGELTPKLIEMQGFPSLYGFQAHLAEQYIDSYGLEKMASFSPFFNQMNKEQYVHLLKEILIGAHEPHEVALMDINAPDQKTAIDFYLTQKYTGLKILSLTDIFREGDQLFYEDNGKKIRLKRIYNRLIFDEIENKTHLFEQSFDPRIPLDIEWITHPNWFYRISKYTMPFLKSDFVPETRFLNEIDPLPTDLENYVLKPLFSFAGLGVVIDVKLQDIKDVKDPHNWILQRKVQYEPVVQALDGRVKAEIRLMYLWPENGEPQLCINLARLSRGKMIGVRYNKDFDWVGGSVGLMEK
ncbi:hypothetical protein DBR11_08940 [Pedobacter sp. HMWF019]|uniref:hypothetical protein n=1 Tax=Pedobacter sp. HMWF019 TaxID=2056856 RepID=UPI000D3A41D3|nr:hypothetical protein [Pedobacter sp. HMWF019]PTT00836.1 hypothetical protein DBR11_08940 [Pedobacter sp. HMWF019]